MAIWACPNDLKVKIVDKWNNYNWDDYKDTMRGILNFMESKQISQENLANNLKIFAQTDQHRKEDLFKSIPVLAQFFS